MATLLKRFSTSSNKSKEDEQFETVDLGESEKPYILTEVYYLSIILFIGLPIWFLTCSSSIYSLPRSDVEITKPRLHLDISVVRLISTDYLHDDDNIKYNDQLRSNLQDRIGKLNISNVNYDLDWRVRRPTIEENRLLKSTQQTGLPVISFIRKFEQGLQELHKQSYRFRLLIFLLEDKICNQQQTYFFGSMQFVYLCSAKDDSILIDQIETLLRSDYLGSVDLSQIKRILRKQTSQTNLLIDLVPQVLDRERLHALADKFHEIYDTEVKMKFIGLPEIVNIRFMTQNIHTFKFENDDKSPRTLEQIYRDFKSKVRGSINGDDRHVLVIIPGPNNSTRTILDGLAETSDSQFILGLTDDQDIARNLRAIVRRIVGLKSTKLHDECLIDTEVFLNRWELDVVVSFLTVLKLDNIHISIESLRKLSRITKRVSMRASEAHRYALEALSNLESRKPLEAYRAASTGNELADKAYFDPELVETSNYFPEGNKYAIYLPLFLPLAIPILMSFIRVIKYFMFSSTSKVNTKQKIN